MCLGLSLFHADSSFCYSRLSSTAIVCFFSDPFRFRCFSLQQRSNWSAISKRKSATGGCTPGVGSDRVPWNKNTLAPHTPSFHTFSFPVVLPSPLSLCFPVGFSCAFCCLLFYWVEMGPCAVHCLLIPTAAPAGSSAALRDATEDAAMAAWCVASHTHMILLTAANTRGGSFVPDHDAVLLHADEVRQRLRRSYSYDADVGSDVGSVPVSNLYPTWLRATVLPLSCRLPCPISLLAAAMEEAAARKRDPPKC